MFGSDFSQPQAATVQSQPTADQNQAATEQESGEDKRVETELATDPQLAEREKHAVADLDRAKEQLQAAKKRAAENYRSAVKGTISGQIFVSTRGGENFELGAVRGGIVRS
jgi:hypothetical protein